MSDRTAALLTWFNSIDEARQLYEVKDIRDGVLVGQALSTHLSTHITGMVAADECLFNARLRVSNLRGVIILLEEFYSKVFRRDISFSSFGAEEMASGSAVATDQLVKLMELGECLSIAC
jgi:HOOK domain